MTPEIERAMARAALTETIVLDLAAGDPLTWAEFANEPHCHLCGVDATKVRVDAGSEEWRAAHAPGCTWARARAWVEGAP